MRGLFIRITLLIFIGILPNASTAQTVFIANDFGNCGVGLKDSSGKWLADPIYARISYCGLNYFTMMLGSKEGVLDYKGKIIIPAIYDYIYSRQLTIDSNSFALFVVKDGDKMGVLNSANEIIVPLICKDITVNYDGTIIAQKSRKRYSFYNLNGKETVIPGKLPEEPYSLGNHLYRVPKNTVGIVVTRRRNYYRHHRRRRYSIKLKHKYGVINDSLRLIIPKEFSSIKSGSDLYSLICVTKHGLDGYYSQEGKEIWKPVFQENLQQYTSSYRPGSNGQRALVINVLGYTEVKKGNKYGIIGVTGDTLLPFIYDNIYSLNSNYRETGPGFWVVRQDNLSGVYDPASRKWILPLEYQFLNFLKSYTLEADSIIGGDPNQELNIDFGTSQNPSGLLLFLAKKNSKFGIISSNGQEILPLQYDYYEPEFGSYFFFQGENVTVVSFPKYQDTMVTRYRNHYAYQIVTDAPKSLQFTKVDKGNGTILFLNEDLLANKKQKQLYNYSKKELVVTKETFDSTLHATAIVIYPLQKPNTILGIGSIYKFQSVYLNSDTTREKIMFSIMPQGYRRIRTLEYFSDDSSYTYYRMKYGSGIFRDDGKVVLAAQSYEYCSRMGISNGLAYFLLEGKGKNRYGIIDGNGKLLVDTIYPGLNGLNGNHVWVRKKVPGIYFWWHPAQWNILDTATHKILLPKNRLSQSGGYLGKEAAVIDREEGPLFFNTTTNKFIQTGPVNEIFKLDQEGVWFAVRTCFGHIGIIDANGKFLTDTIWTALIHADNDSTGPENIYYRNTNYRNTHNYNLCVLSNDTGWVIFNGTTGTISHDRMSANFLLYKAKNSFTIDPRNGIQKYCIDCPSFIFVDDTLNSQKLLTWQEKMLFDSLFSGETFMADSLHSWFSYPCTTCRKTNPKQSFQYDWSKNYDKETLNHEVYFVNDSCLSVARSNLSIFSWSNNQAKDLFFTSLLFKDGPHTMLLDSLFIGNEWKTFISNEVSLYFESHPNIEGNCHNPFMLPFVMKNRFLITSKGISLYPPNFRENNSQLSVPIPWEKLKPYLRKDVALKLGVGR